MTTRPAITFTARPTGRDRTVLVMEDDAPSRDLLVELLDQAGFSVLEAADGQHGLSLARERRPNVILLDLSLPPTSGLDVLDRLRAEQATRHIPVVVVSGQPPSAATAGTGQPDAYIRKPFDIGDLLAHVERVAALPEGR